MVPYPALLSKFGIPVGRFEIALHFEAARAKRKPTVPLLDAVFVGLLVFSLFFLALTCRGEPTWVSTGAIAGVNAPVFSSTIDSNGNLYVGGDFTVAGATMASRVAMWDGSDWKSLSDGLNGYVLALCQAGGLLYAGGTFNRSGQVPIQNIAIWDGYSWTPIPGTPTNEYRAMTVDGGTAYLAAEVGTNGCSVWRHSAGEWTIIASEFSGYIRDLEVSNGILYAAGYFSVSNGVPAQQVAKWDGTAWQSLGVFDGSVSTLLPFENELYAGGSFTNSGTTPTRYVAKWNGTRWEPLGQGTPSQVLHLAAAGTNIIATGGGAVAKWDGREWHEIGTNFEATVGTAVAYNTNVYVCGGFSLWNLRFVNHVARLEGTNWGSLGHGLAGSIDVVASDGDALYAAGVLDTSSFSEGPALACRVVQWQDGAWSTLGQTFDSVIQALLVHEGYLYAAGRFTRAGELNLSHIARWDGTNWHPLGAGFNDDVGALAVFNGDLYAGGRFTASGALQVKYAARWNGANWVGLGEGPQTKVTAMASMPHALFVAGQTLQSWDGFSWSDWADGAFRSACSSGSNVFFGGEFSDDNGYFHGVVRWDGSEWSLIGSNFNDAVLALAWIDGVLYAGGNFTALGELAFPYLAAWDGQAWHAAQSSPNSSVNSIWARDGEIYLGGSFSAVGSRASALVAKGIVGERIKSLAVNAPGLGTNTIRFNGTPLGKYGIEYSDGLYPQKWSILGTTNVSTYGSGSIGDPSPHPVSRFYRLRRD